MATQEEHPPDLKLVPEAGREYRDRDGGPRRLWVESLHPGDGLGREVRGTLSWPGTSMDGREYSTGLKTFGYFWRPA